MLGLTVDDLISVVRGTYGVEIPDGVDASWYADGSGSSDSRAA